MRAVLEHLLQTGPMREVGVHGAVHDRGDDRVDRERLQQVVPVSLNVNEKFPVDPSADTESRYGVPPSHCVITSFCSVVFCIGSDPDCCGLLAGTRVPQSIF